MARNKGPELTRLNLEIPEKVRERLEELQEESNATSMTEIVRRGLSLYDLLFTHQAKNGSIILKYPNGDEEKLKLL